MAKESKRDGASDPTPDSFFLGGQFNPSILADHILEKITVVTFRDTKEMYFYDPKSGIYRSEGETVIREEATRLLGNRYRRNNIAETVTIIRDRTYQNREALRAPPNLLVVMNGILDVLTGELKPFSPKHFATQYLPVTYDPDSDCPDIKKFLREVVRAEVIPLLQEMIGYCIYRRYSIHKAFVLFGSGRNGKTTFLNLLQAFLGYDNVSAVPLQDLRQRFAVESLYSKLANISDDLSDRDIRDTGNFKKLTGESLIRADKKFVQPFHFRNYAKMIFATNKIPTTTEDSEAFFRRLMMIEFPFEFTEGVDADLDILERLTTEEELSGLLNWAIVGLARLLRIKRFSTSKGIEETRIFYLSMSDPVFRFMHECLELSATSTLSKEEAYDQYKLFCKSERLVTVGYQAFCKRITSLDGVSLTRPSRFGKRVQSFRGIKMKGR